MIRSYNRLLQLARVLKDTRPKFRSPVGQSRISVGLTPEQRVVLEALAVEGGVKVTEALQRIVDAALENDRVLVRWVFFGEPPPSQAAKDRILRAARKEAGRIGAISPEAATTPRR